MSEISTCDVYTILVFDETFSPKYVWSVNVIDKCICYVDISDFTIQSQHQSCTVFRMCWRLLSLKVKVVLCVCFLLMVRLQNQRLMSVSINSLTKYAVNVQIP